MIFFNVDEALSFINQSDSYPVVGKTNIGASGSGVTILKSKEDSIKYIINAFTKGVKSISGPKIFKGSILKKINKLITKKDFLRHRLKEYEATVNQVQKGFVIFQEYIPHSFEWRCVRIGESYFAHKKMVKNEMASGTLTKGYENPPLALMDFIKKITDEFSLKSVSIDLFQTGDKFLINEIQCFFGQSDPYQMLIDGKPGRYKNVNNSWIFEEGMFNTNQSYDLRVEHALSLINKRT
jgi:glutathione synthase/RimK-type ligase-like ATP-grasp enzyme